MNREAQEAGKDTPKPAKIRIFCATVVREYLVRGKPVEWLLMNGKERGFARFSPCSFASLSEVLERCDVRFGALGKDEHSLFVEVLPL